MPCRRSVSLLAVFVVLLAAGTAAAQPFSLRPPVTYPSGDTPNGHLRIGDLNGDSRPDIVVANYFDDTISVLLNLGGGVYGPRTPYASVGSPQDIALADVNNDSRLDVLVAARSGVGPFRNKAPGIEVYLGNGDGTLQPFLFSPLAPALEGWAIGPSSIVAGQMNTDGRIDVVVTRHAGFRPNGIDSIYTIEVALGNGAGSFALSARRESNWGQPILADFDSDSDLDVVEVSGEDTKLWLGDGLGGLAGGAAIYSRFATGMYGADVGDVNNDGEPDVVFTTDPSLGGDPETIVTLLGNGNGTFRAPVTTILPGERSLSSRLVDMNGDGWLDFVHENDGAGDPALQLYVSFGAGDGTFHTHQTFGLPSWIGKLDVADVNGNGVPDVVVGVYEDVVAVLLDSTDDVAPVITTPGDLRIPAGAAGTAVATFDVSAVDDVDGPVAVACAPPSGSTFALGSTLVTCEAADEAGNHASATFTVTVVRQNRPVITLPGTIKVEATGPNGAIAEWQVSAIDLEDGPLDVTCSAVSGSLFPLGLTEVACEATDNDGHTVSGSFDLWVRDTTPPVLTLPANITVNATSALGAQVFYNATAVDLVAGNRFLYCSKGSGAKFAIGVTTVTCNARDWSNNRAVGSFTVTVKP